MPTVGCPTLDPTEHPILFCLLMMAIPFWRNFHFYWIHRLIHWKPLYDRVHYIHHKNVNVGPWSGIAMHPVEHIIYFSGILIHIVCPLPSLAHDVQWIPFRPWPGNQPFRF